jgi:hypothetical protein
MGLGAGKNTMGGFGYLMPEHAGRLGEAKEGFSFYESGSLCEDYFIEFRAVTPNKLRSKVALNGKTGIMTNKNFSTRLGEDGNILPYDAIRAIELDLQNPTKTPDNRSDEFDEKSLKEHGEGPHNPEFLFKYYHSDEFDILSPEIMLTKPKGYSLGISKLSDILNKLSEKRRADASIPDLFISHHCRGGCEGTSGLDRLSECGKLHFKGIELEELPQGLLGITHFDDVSLRRETSLSSSSLLNNFSMVIQELFDYATTNNSSWLVSIQGVYDDIIRHKKFMILDNNLVCLLLQLRHTLSSKDVP